MIVLDTNLLVYAFLEETSEHHAAQRAIERACQNPAGWGVASPTLSEFWCVTTHSRCRGGPAPLSLARQFLTRLLAEGCGKIWQPGSGFAQRLLQLAEELNVAGPRIFDLQIALIGFENGATELWSHDKNFATIPGLRLHDPIG